MLSCDLPYIPDRLHTDDKLNNNTFVVGEFLYMRCSADVLDNPYKSISITELSHNRSGLGNSISEPDDVLFNIKADDEIEKYEDKQVCTLEIVDLNHDNGYRKTFTQIKNDVNVEAILELLHLAEPCMYPHCVFRITINNEIITYGNYKDTIQKLTMIRTKIKDELASMVVREQVSQESTPNLEY